MVYLIEEVRLLITLLVNISNSMTNLKLKGVTIMEIKLQDVPSVFEGQYTDDINGNTLYYNPLGYGGVTVVDGATQTMLGLCNGKNTVGRIIELDSRSPETSKNELDQLAEREVIRISDNFTNDLHHSLAGKGSLSCWLHLTNNCNLACSYCYIYKSPGNMSLDTGKMAIDKMIQSCRNHKIGNLNIKFSGGEPLLRFDLMKELIEYSQQTKDEVDVTYTMLSNGVLITKQVADYLKQNKIGVGVSLDGVGNINDICRYDKSRKGSYEDVLKGLGYLKESGVVPSIMTTVSSSNYPFLLDHTKFLLENGYRFRFSLERDCDTGKPELLNHKKELIVSLLECYDYIETNLPSEDITKIHTFGDVNFKEPSRKSCSAGRNFFSIGFDGKLGVCGLGLATPFGKLEYDHDLLNYIRSSNPELATNIASSYSKCRYCVWNKSCAAGCSLQTKATYGTFNHASPYCEVYQQILPRILRIKAMQMIRGS